MRFTNFICEIGNIRHDLAKAEEYLISHADSKQFVSAAVELGRMQELANRLAAVCRLAGEALWEDSQGVK